MGSCRKPYHWKAILQVAVFYFYFIGSVAFQPDFAEPIKNMSVPVGRDATFQCVVHHLGGYRVGWVKADTKAIQAIHDHVITHNPRISVSHNDHVTWNLHIKNVQEEDRGQYMCQINTDPMKSQVGFLDVSVPPDFTEETSGDLLVPEGGTVKLTCRARGHPDPHVQWRREDGKDIVIREPTGLKTKVSSYQGEMLQLWKISRTEMGAYMCIASNGVPPTVSKRVMVNVHFHPVIHVPNQLVGAPLGTDVTLECYVEAFPKSINYWVRDTGEMVISSNKYDVQAVSRSAFEVKMIVTIRSLQKDDVGSYRCIAKNSLGEVESNIRLYEALRKYPPLSNLPKLCTKAYKIPGTNATIDPYTMVDIPLLGLHNDPKYFPEPHKFKPERFSAENKDKIINYTYMPFGDGPRQCLEIPGPTRSYTLTLDEEDYNEQLGSAERDQDEDFLNTIVERNKPLGFSTLETPNSERSNHVADKESAGTLMATSLRWLIVGIILNF